MSEGTPPETIEFAGGMEEIGGIVAQMLLSKASRERRAIDETDWLNAATGLIGAAYNLAKCGGDGVLAEYANILRDHADQIAEA